MKRRTIIALCLSITSVALLSVASIVPAASASTESSAAKSHAAASRTAIPTGIPNSNANTTVITPPGATANTSFGVGSAYICTIVSGTGFTSGLGAVVGYAYTTDCSGAAACYQTADLQEYQGRITGGWVALADGPLEEGCTEASASVVSEGCTSSSLLWEYRSIGYYTVYWENGEISNATLTSNVVSADAIC